MRSGIVLAFIQTALLLTRATAQTSMPELMHDQTSIDASRYNASIQQIEDNNLRLRPFLLRIKTVYGNETYYDFLTKPHFATLRDQLGSKEENDDSIQVLAHSPSARKAAKSVRVGAVISDNGYLDTAPFDRIAYELQSKEIRKLLKNDASLDEAARRDVVTADEIANQSFNLLGLPLNRTNAALLETAINTKLSLFYSADGTLSHAHDDEVRSVLTKHFVEALRHQPLTDIQSKPYESVKMVLTHNSKEENGAVYKDMPSLKQLEKFSNIDPVYWNVLRQTSSTLMIGDVLDDTPGSFRLSGAKIDATYEKIKNETKEYVRHHAKLSAELDANVLQYILNSGDKTGAVDMFVLDHPLIDAIRTDHGNPLKFTPPESMQNLQDTKLSAVLTSDGDFNVAAMRDLLIEKIKDKPVFDMFYYIAPMRSPNAPMHLDFAEALGTEIGSVLVGYSYHPDDEELSKLLKNTTMVSFLSGGDEKNFNEKQLAFGKNYPVEKRMKDMGAHHGEGGATRPWRQGQPPPEFHLSDPTLLPPTHTGTAGVSPFLVTPPAQATKILPIIPGAVQDLPHVHFSFDIKSNTLKPHDGEVRPLTEPERDMSRYWAWRLSDGICGTFTETPGVLPIEPDSTGKFSSRGIVIYATDLSKATIYGSTEHNVVGQADGSEEIKGLQRVDIALHDPEMMPDAISAREKKPDTPKQASSAMNMGTQGHEEEHAFYGAADPYRPMGIVMPGTDDKPYDHGFHFLQPDGTNVTATTDDSILFYKKGTFDMITEAELDLRIGQSAFGACPVSYDPAYGKAITLRAGDDGDIVKNRNPLIAWTSTTANYGQLIVINPDANPSLDLTKVGVVPVRLSAETPLDLNSPTHDVFLNSVDWNTHYQYTRISIAGGVIRNATVTVGTIIGTPGDDNLEVTLGGKLKAGSGNDTLIGGTTESTEFTGGPGHKVFKLRAGSSSADIVDYINDYKSGDTIVAPAGTKQALYSRVPETAAGVESINPSTLYIRFMDDKNREIKSVIVQRSGNMQLDTGDLTVMTTDGQKLSPVLDPEAQNHTAPDRSPVAKRETSSSPFIIR